MPRLFRIARPSGATNRRANADLIQALRRMVRGESFDEQPMLDLDSEANEFRAASERDNTLAAWVLMRTSRLAEPAPSRDL